MGAEAPFSQDYYTEHNMFCILWRLYSSNTPKMYDLTQISDWRNLFEADFWCSVHVCYSLVSIAAVLWACLTRDNYLAPPLHLPLDKKRETSVIGSVFEGNQVVLVFGTHWLTKELVKLTRQ